MLENLYRVLKLVGEKASGDGVGVSIAIFQGIPAQSFLLLSSVAMLVSSTILVAGSWISKVLLPSKGTDVQKENTITKSAVEPVRTIVPKAEVQPAITQPMLRGGVYPDGYDEAMLYEERMVANSLQIPSTLRDYYGEAEHKSSNSSQIPSTRRKLKSNEPWINDFLNPNKGPGYVKQSLEPVSLDCFPAIAQVSSSVRIHAEQVDDNSHWVKLYNEQEDAYIVKNDARAKL